MLSLDKINAGSEGKKRLFSPFYVGKVEAKRLAHSRSSPGESKRIEARLLRPKTHGGPFPEGVLRCGDLIAVILEEKW